MDKVTPAGARKALASLKGLPVAITKDGETVAVLLSIAQYNELCKRSQNVPQAKKVTQKVVPGTPEPVTQSASDARWEAYKAGKLHSLR